MQNQTDPVVGAVFSSRWRVERPLSEGGMGSVYVAQHTETGRRVALKVIKREGAMNHDLIARFKRETSSLAAVSHPNIVTFLDSGIEDGSWFLVMELLNGTSLRAAMARPMDWQRAFRICSDILRGLAAVHASGLVHRDLKPENIFLQASVGHDDFAKLIDFGIVRLERDGTSSSMKTETGAIIGTPGYISAEALAGQPTTPLSDLYAVGVILYELVTGAFPFEAPTVQAMWCVSSSSRSRRRRRSCRSRLTSTRSSSRCSSVNLHDVRSRRARRLRCCPRSSPARRRRQDGPKRRRCRSLPCRCESPSSFAPEFRARCASASLRASPWRSRSASSRGAWCRRR